jgi:transposase-like protein
MFKYEKILRMLEGGKTVDEVAKSFKVSRQYVYSVNNKYGKGKISTGVEKKAKQPNAKTQKAMNEALTQLRDAEVLSSMPWGFKMKAEEKDDWVVEISDPVHHPDHYTAGGIETIDFIEAKKLGYNLGNVIKYVSRADHKGKREQDLNKALWYLLREIDKCSESNEGIAT